MKFPSAISAALFLFAATGPLHGQDGLSDADKALFDDLQVTEEAEKSARQRIEKSETPPQPELSAAAAKILDRLQVFEVSINDITDESIILSRKSLSEQLIKLSNTAAEPGKTELIATAKNIEGLAPGAELPPAGETAVDFPGDWKKGKRDTYSYDKDGNAKTSWGSRGKWRWLNGSQQIVITDYANKGTVHVLRLIAQAGKPPVAEGFNDDAAHFTLVRDRIVPGKPALPGEAIKLITAARAHESRVRSASLKQTGEKRERVAAWLVERAKSDPPASAKLLLDNAGKLRAGTSGPVSGKTLRNTGAFRGQSYIDKKQRTWEFLPDGTVKSKRAAWGSWEWAKAAEDSSIIIYSGGPGRADNPMLVRQSGSSPGTLHFIGFDEKFDAKLKP